VFTTIEFPVVSTRFTPRLVFWTGWLTDPITRRERETRDNAYVSSRSRSYGLPEGRVVLREVYWRFQVACLTNYKHGTTESTPCQPRF